MGGEYYIRVKKPAARKIVLDALSVFKYDKEHKYWLFPDAMYAQCENPKKKDEWGDLPGLQVIQEPTKGTFEISYSSWASDEVNSYILAVFSEIRKVLKKNGMDFDAFGNGAVGDYKYEEWDPIVRLGYYKYWEHMSKKNGKEDHRAYYKAKLAMLCEMYPNAFKDHKRRVKELQVLMRKIRSSRLIKNGELNV